MDTATYIKVKSRKYLTIMIYEDILQPIILHEFQLNIEHLTAPPRTIPEVPQLIRVRGGEISPITPL